MVAPVHGDPVRRPQPLEREEKSGDNKSWKTVEDVSSEAPFWIQDRTGHVLVRPKDSRCTPA